jgi:hypothetical protein
MAQDTVNAAPGDSSARGDSAATRSSDTLGVPRAPGRIDCARPALARRTSCRRECKCKKHRKARAVQHSEGQHDDLACLPGARSRERGHRGAAASWHGSGPPRRHARRVVSAAPDARTSFGLTRLSRSPFPGNRISGPEKNAQKRPADCNAAVSENEPSHRSPPIRGLSYTFRKSPVAPDCVVAHAVQIGPVSATNSLRTGKLTGNFADSGPNAAFRRAVAG